MSVLSKDFEENIDLIYIKLLNEKFVVLRDGHLEVVGNISDRCTENMGVYCIEYYKAGEKYFEEILSNPLMRIVYKFKNFYSAVDRTEFVCRNCDQMLDLIEFIKHPKIICTSVYRASKDIDFSDFTGEKRHLFLTL
jgi:hypothetical protein